jgi:hypothetical protein
MSERAQLFTLEAFVAAIVLLATLAFSLQAVGISSNTASGGEMEIQSQHAGLAEGVLAETVEDGSLKQTLLYWNVTANSFHHADDSDGGYYISRSPPTAFGDLLQPRFDERQVRYNINLSFRNENNDRQRQQLVESGTPGGEAVQVVQTVTLYDEDQLVDENGTSRNVTLADVDEGFYAPDTGTDSQIYNVIRVEVVLWQS